MREANYAAAETVKKIDEFPQEYLGYLNIAMELVNVERSTYETDLIDYLNFYQLKLKQYEKELVIDFIRIITNELIRIRNEKNG